MVTLFNTKFQLSVKIAQIVNTITAKLLFLLRTTLALHLINYTL